MNSMCLSRSFNWHRPDMECLRWLLGLLYEICTTTVILSHLMSRDLLELANRVNFRNLPENMTQ